MAAIIRHGPGGSRLKGMNQPIEASYLYDAAVCRLTIEIVGDSKQGLLASMACECRRSVLALFKFSVRGM